jgi:hypothetical protein
MEPNWGTAKNKPPCSEYEPALQDDNKENGCTRSNITMHT